MIYNIKFLPARYGDCIWIEYGEPDRLNHILIDGGTGGTKKEIKELLEALPPEQRVFELMVVTHIDRDHIEGILSLLEEDTLSFRVKSIWFNGWPHLQENPEVESFGAVQGERLTAAILKHGLPWNSHFGGKAVAIANDGPLPEIILEGGMKITVLSPTVKNLSVLRDAWKDEVLKAGLKPGFGAEVPEDVNEDIEAFGLDMPDVEALAREKFKEDDAAANASSIAFIASYGKNKALFTGDALPSIISRSLERANYVGPIELVKLSHHASKGNTSPTLISQIDCDKFVISTNGSIFHHPAAVTIARIITLKNNPQLIFNYTSDHNKVWGLPSLQQKYNYSTIHPLDEGISISLNP